MRLYWLSLWITTIQGIEKRFSRSENHILFGATFKYNISRRFFRFNFGRANFPINFWQIFKLAYQFWPKC